MDKHYLMDLESNGINVTPTYYAEPGDKISLTAIIDRFHENELILKPAVSGAARHTYRINNQNAIEYENLFQSLLQAERVLSEPELAGVIILILNVKLS